jgi:hypothetical protein
MSLQTGRKVTRTSWTELPTPRQVVERVHAQAADQPEKLVFYDRHGRAIDDSSTNIELTDNEVGLPIEEEQEEVAVAAQMQDCLLHEGLTDEEDPSLSDDAPRDEYTHTGIEHGREETPDRTNEVLNIAESNIVTQTDGSHEQGNQVPVNIIHEDVEHALQPRISARTKTPAQRYQPTMTGKSYNYTTTVLEPTVHPDQHVYSRQDPPISVQMVGAIMTQLSMKAGIKQWGKAARDACKAEMYQLHMRETFEPLAWEDLSTEQKKQTLESHLFLKMKRDGTIKGRTVAGGNKQRLYIHKEDATSPTVATESVLLTAFIDAFEHRDVAVVDIPNAFIQTRIDKEDEMAIIRIREELVDMLVEIAPDTYKPYVSVNHKGLKTLIVRCHNAIYGTMVASIQYSRKFTKSLLDEGFSLNPYDPCVANKTIDRHQMSICFHVDDCKISHRNAKEVDNVIQWLRTEYESIFEDGSGKMKVPRGKIHEYLGMTLDFSSPGVVRVTMLKYIDEVIEHFLRFDTFKLKSTAAPEDLSR